MRFGGRGGVEVVDEGSEGKLRPSFVFVDGVFVDGVERLWVGGFSDEIFDVLAEIIPISESYLHFNNFINLPHLHFIPYTHSCPFSCPFYPLFICFYVYVCNSIDLLSSAYYITS